MNSKGIHALGALVIFGIVIVGWLAVSGLTAVTTGGQIRPTAQICKWTVGQLTDVVPCDAVPLSAFESGTVQIVSGSGAGSFLTDGTGAQQAVSPVDCTHTPDLVARAYDVLDNGTEYGDLNVTVYRKSATAASFNKKGTYNVGSTIADLGYGDSIILYFNSGTTVNTYNGRTVRGGDNTWTAVDPKILGSAPCQGTWDVAVLIEKMGDVKIALFNTDDGLINSSTDQQAIADGQQVNMKIKFDENKSNGFYGSQFAPLNSGPLFFCDVNAGALDTAESCVLSGSMTTVSASEPTGREIDSTLDANLGKTITRRITAFDNGKPYLKEYGSSTGTLVIKSKSNVEAGINNTADYFKVCTLNSRLFQDDAGEWNWHYRDPDTGAALAPEYCTKVYYS